MYLTNKIKSTTNSYKIRRISQKAGSIFRGIYNQEVRNRHIFLQRNGIKKHLQKLTDPKYKMLSFAIIFKVCAGNGLAGVAKGKSADTICSKDSFLHRRSQGRGYEGNGYKLCNLKLKMDTK